MQGHVQEDVQAFLDAHGPYVTNKVLLSVLQRRDGRNRPKRLQIGAVTDDENVLRVEAATGDGQVSLTAPERVVLNFSAFPWATDTWGKTLAGGIALELGGSKSGATLTWHEENGHTTAQADVDFTAVAGESSLRGGIHGRMTGVAGEIPDTVAIDEIRIETVHFPSSFGSVSGQARISDVTGPLLTAVGAARLDATLTKVRTCIAAFWTARRRSPFPRWSRRCAFVLCSCPCSS